MCEGGVGGACPLLRPQERVRPAFFKEKAEDDFGTGGMGMSLKGLSCGDLPSSRRGRSVDEAAVDVALNRDELSAVDMVLDAEAPLSLHSSQYPHNIQLPAMVFAIHLSQLNAYRL